MKPNEFLQSIREETKLSRNSFSKLIGVKERAIINYERGERTISSDYIEIAAAMFGFLPELFTLSDICENDVLQYKLTKFSKSLRYYQYFSQLSDQEISLLCKENISVDEVRLLKRIKANDTALEPYLEIMTILLAFLDNFKVSSFVDDYSAFSDALHAYAIGNRDSSNWARVKLVLSLTGKISQLEQNGYSLEPETIRKSLINKSSIVKNEDIERICELLEFFKNDTFMLQKVEKFLNDEKVRREESSL